MTAVAQNPLVGFLDRYERNWPLLVREVLGGEPDEYQEALLNAVCAGVRRISIRSGHGVGKTTGLAFCIICHALTREPQKTLCTAPTSTQLFDALAAETKSWFRRLPPALQDIFEIKVDQIVHREAPDSSFITFATARAETPEALAGKHSANMLIIADEASGVPEQVFEAAFGSMSGHDATFVLTGNPIRSSGLFFDTHHRLKHAWTTFHIPCEREDGTLHPRISPQFVAEAEEMYGRDTNQFRVRVLGEFPRAEDDVVIPFELIETALKRDVRPTMVRTIWGVDAAYTGGDRSTLAKRKGNTLTEKVKSWKGLDTMQMVGVVHNEWKDTVPSERPEEILVDSIGYGAGVADRLRELGLPARGINVAELPAMKERYVNLKTELWFTARDWFAARDCNICDDQMLARELAAVHYLPPTSSGKMQLEPKDKVKKVLRASPDLAEAFILTFASTAASALHGSKHSTSWTQPLKRQILGIV